MSLSWVRQRHLDNRNLQRYIGQAKTHLQNVLTATAMNVVRTSLWLAETPRATTRQSAFVRLYKAAA